jgi:hypothetical protein
MKRDDDTPKTKARMVVCSSPLVLGLSGTEPDKALPPNPPGTTLTKLSQPPPRPRQETVDSPPAVGTPLSCKNPTREALATRAALARVPAPCRKANAPLRQVLIEPSPLAGGAVGLGVFGRFIGRVAKSDDRGRSCRLAGKKILGWVWLCGNGSGSRVQPCQHPLILTQTRATSKPKGSCSLFSEIELVPWCLVACSLCCLQSGGGAVA